MPEPRTIPSTDPRAQTHPRPHERPLMDDEGLYRPTGSTRKFVIVSLLLVSAMGAAVLALGWWMHVTAKPNYTGPDPLNYPERRPYR